MLFPRDLVGVFYGRHTLKQTLSFRAVQLALDGQCSVARKVSGDRGCSGVADQWSYEVIKAIPEERVSGRIVEQSVDVLVPLMRREDR